MCVSVAIDLASPNESAGDRDRDKVVYQGRQDAGDMIAVTSETGQFDWTDLQSGEQKRVDQSVVQLSDTSDHHLMNVTILNSDPTNDLLEIDGLGGSDWLRVDAAPANAQPVSDLIHVILVGGEGSDLLETSYRVSPQLLVPGTIDVFGGSRWAVSGNAMYDPATDTLIVTGDPWSTERSYLQVSDQGVTVRRHADDQVLQQLNYHFIDEFQLKLGTSQADNVVRIANAISGPVSIYDGPGDDELLVESLPVVGAKTIVLDGGGTNTVTLGLNGNVDSVERLSVWGGDGYDCLVYNSSAEELPISVEVDRVVGGGPVFRVEGKKNNSITYSPVIYDNDIDEIVLRLGAEDDRVTVPDLRRRMRSDGAGGRVSIEGGGGDNDELFATLPQDPPSGLAEGPACLRPTWRW